MWVSEWLSKFIKSPASGPSDLIYNNLKSNKTTYKSYNNIIMKRKLIQINWTELNFMVNNACTIFVLKCNVLGVDWYHGKRSWMLLKQ